jgi:KUP system potassium uptake protein
LLSAVFLALTGGEALYADMGHFGAKAVRIAWYGLVWPALMLNYFGQGALLMREASAIANPFYLLAPEMLRLPLVVLATFATVIASQATISGTFSITAQAVHLGYLPRLRIRHTSDQERGQVFVPSVNLLMLLAVVVVVLLFRSSGRLAAAYGIAVSGTMLITTLLASLVVALSPGRYRWLSLGAFGLFGLLEVGFLSSNLMKIADGGWLPLALGAVVFALLTTWKEGAGLLAEKRREMDIPLDMFLQGPAPEASRVPGTAIYLTSDLSVVPSALFHNLKHYKVMHETTVFLRVCTEDIPHVEEEDRMKIRQVGPHEWVIEAHFGFRDEPDIPQALAGTHVTGLVLDPMQCSYFVARSLVVEGPGALSRWRNALFAWMTRQADSPASYFRLPPNAVVELGTQVVL